MLRLEQEHIFKRSWQYVGTTADVAEPGMFFTCRLGDVPVVVLRDKEGELRGFVNVCRHRGHEVVAGLRQARDAAVPVPRLDVRARRLAAGGPALRP